MRVLIINPEFYVYGGAERVIIRLANYLTEHNVSNTIITPKILPVIKQELVGTRIIETETIEKLVPVLHSIIHKFDVINPHNDPAQIASYPRRKPTVWLCNEPPIQVLTGGQLDDLLRNIVRNHIDIAVVADKFNKQRFQKIYGFTPQVNHYGVEGDFFAEGDKYRIKEKYGLSDTFVVLQVGMLTFTKNQLKTVSVFKEVKKQIPEAKLVLAGFDNTPYKKTVMRRIRTSGLRKNVVFTGDIPQEDIRDFYYAADVLLAPIMAQGGWLSTFEAMVTGLPVIVSPEMTASPIIKKHQLGTVTDDYADAVLAVYGKRRRTTRPGQWVKDNLKWETFCENMLGYFEEVMP